MRLTKTPTQYRPSLWADFEEALNPFFNLPTGTQKLSYHVPYNIQETDEFYQLSVDVPGVDPKHIQLKVQGDALHVSSKETEESKHTKRHRSFCTSFTLPHHVDTTKIEANVENGVMDIVLPKKKEAQVKEIPVQSSSSNGFIEKFKKIGKMN